MTEEYQGGVKVAKCRSPPCLGEGRPLIKSHVYVILIFLFTFPFLYLLPVLHIDLNSIYTLYPVVVQSILY